VGELRTELAERGAPTCGLKEELVDRLFALFRRAYDEGGELYVAGAGSRAAAITAVVQKFKDPDAFAAAADADGVGLYKLNAVYP
jgi:hypothetical protein